MMTWEEGLTHDCWGITWVWRQQIRVIRVITGAQGIPVAGKHVGRVVQLEAEVQQAYVPLPGCL